MKRYWTFHWQNRGWRAEVSVEGRRLRSSGSNRFRDQEVSVGDSVYVVTLIDGLLYLGGRMSVGKIVSKSAAMKLLGRSNLYDASEWIIGAEAEGTPLNLHRRLEPSLSRRLLFRSPDGRTRRLCFVSKTRLDSQATRGLQELTEESALLLELILQATDRTGISAEVLTVTEAMLPESIGPLPGAGGLKDSDHEPTADPVELDRRVARLRRQSTSSVPSGQAAPASKPTSGTSFFRDPAVKAWVLWKARGRCEACGGLAPFQGDDGEPFLEVHHLRSLASGGSDRVSNAVALCPKSPEDGR